jgi:hypothetical protein
LVITGLSNTQWSVGTVKLLYWARRLAELLALGESVLLSLERHNDGGGTKKSDGDAIFVLSSLIQVFVDPYFRTTLGFAALIEKEWMAYGSFDRH